MRSRENREAMDTIDAMGQALMTLEDYYDKMTSATISKGMHKQGNNMTTYATLELVVPMQVRADTTG